MLHKRQGLHPIFCNALSNPTQSPRVLSIQNSNAHVPRAPHRRLQNDSPTALGVGRASTSIPLLVEKPIVRSPWPSEFNEHLRAQNTQRVAAFRSRTHAQNKATSLKERLPSIVCDEEIEKLSVKRFFTSTTREATEEAALPTPRWPVPRTTLEREADPVSVRSRTMRYSSRPSLWQHYAREWDAMQLRTSSDREDCDLSLPQVGKNCLLSKPNSLNETLPRPQDFVFLRPMPGYRGFIPRHAVEPRPLIETDCVSDCMCSTSRRTYRSFAASEYKVLQHAHKGPFSKTVTMTHPLNPFNKIEHRTRCY